MTDSFIQQSLLSKLMWIFAVHLLRMFLYDKYKDQDIYCMKT